jgi:hypothetical protein
VEFDDMNSVKFLLSLTAMLVVSFSVPKHAVACGVFQPVFDLWAFHRFETARGQLFADVVFKGRVVEGKSNGPVHTFTVEQTYRGPVRKQWVVSVPLGKNGQIWMAGLPSGEESLGVDPTPETDTFVIGMAKYPMPHSSAWRRENLTAAGEKSVEYRVLGGSGACTQPFFFRYTDRLGTRLEFAFAQNSNRVDAKRDRQLRKYFGFTTSHRGLQFLVAKIEASTKRLIKRHQQNIGIKYVQDRLNEEKWKIQLRRRQALERKYANTRHELLPIAAVPLTDYEVRLLEQERKDWNWMLNAFDTDNDQFVTESELVTAIKLAFRAYDRNDNGLVDDFEVN